MDGTAELLRLAHLLRVSASTARDIATMRRVNGAEIDTLAQLTETIAADLEKIARSPTGDSQSLLARSD